MKIEYYKYVSSPLIISDYKLSKRDKKKVIENQGVC